LESQIQETDTVLNESKSNIDLCTKYLAEWHSSKGEFFHELEAKINHIQHLEDGLGFRESWWFRGFFLGFVLLATVSVIYYSVEFRPFWWESYTVGAFVVGLITILYWFSIIDRIESLLKLREEVHSIATKWKMYKPNTPVKDILTTVKEEAVSIEKQLSSEKSVFSSNTKNLKLYQTQWRAHRSKLQNMTEKLRLLRNRSKVSSLDEMQNKMEIKKTVLLELSFLTDQVNRILSTKGREEWDFVVTKLEPYKNFLLDDSEDSKSEITDQINKLETELNKALNDETDLKLTLEKHGLKTPEEIWVWTDQQISEKKRFEQLKKTAVDSIETLMQLDTDQEKFFTAVLTRGEKSPSKLFETVTEGMYKNILLHDEQIFVESHDGDQYPVNVLSSGTREQLSFCLRLAMAQKLFRQPSFLILDDPFLFCDPDRLTLLLTMLESIINNGWQILYFTFDDDVVRYFKRSNLEPHYFQLK